MPLRREETGIRRGWLVTANYVPGDRVVLFPLGDSAEIFCMRAPSLGLRLHNDAASGVSTMKLAKVTVEHVSSRRSSHSWPCHF